MNAHRTAALVASLLLSVAAPAGADSHGHPMPGASGHAHDAAGHGKAMTGHGTSQGHGAAAPDVSGHAHEAAGHGTMKMDHDAAKGHEHASGAESQHDHSAHGHETGDAMHGGHGKTATGPQTLDLARSKASMGGHFQVAVAPAEEPLRLNHLHSWTVRVADHAGKPVEGATIQVDGGMPEHGHGLPTAPRVTRYLGGGIYLLEGVRFSMNGWWNLDIRIEADGVQDMVAFDLVVE